MNNADTPTRKLTAIMFTDMVGYTALMEKDEQHTRELVERHRKIMAPLIDKHGGKVLQYIGDGTFCTFGSAIEAVNSAVEIQNALRDESEIQIRVGIHEGDLVVDGDEVYGDGVNVASRIESIAAPGGICITGRVYDDIRNQPEIKVASLGRRKLKNVERPVAVYALSGEGLSIPDIGTRFFRRPAVRRTLGSLSAIFMLTLIYVLFFPGKEPLYGDVPSLGVLYLDNLGATEDEYYSYGITEDLIIDLSKAGLIRVPPMKDVLKYKESELSLSEIARNLSVRFVLTGSLRKEEESFRLAVQLIEPAMNRTIWGDRWEGPVSEVSSIKGKMVGEVVDVLGLMPEGDVAEIIGKTTVDADAYELYLKGKFRYGARKTMEDVMVARGLLEKAIELDSTFIPPRLKLANTFTDGGDYKSAMNILSDALPVAEEKGNATYLASVLRNTGMVLYRLSDYDGALDHYSRSMELSNHAGDRFGEAQTLNGIGNVYYRRGDYDKALDFYNRSLNLKREMGDRSGEGKTINNIGIVYRKLGDYDKALEYYEQALQIRTEIGDPMGKSRSLNSIAIVYYRLGDYDKALEFYARSLAISKEIGERDGEGATLNNIADIYHERGEYEKAFEYYSRSLAIFQDIGNKDYEAEVLKNFGFALVGLGRYEEALERLSRSLDICRELGDRAGEAEVLGGIGNIHHQRGEYEKAFDFYTSRLTAVEELGGLLEKGLSYSDLGRLYFHRGDYSEAAEHLSAAVEIFAGIGTKIKVLEPLSYLALCAAVSSSEDSVANIARRLEENISTVEIGTVEPVVLMNASRLFSRIEQTEKADYYLQKAYNNLMQRANGIKNEEYRRSFLTAVRDNREIVAAWEKN